MKLIPLLCALLHFSLLALGQAPPGRPLRAIKCSRLLDVKTGKFINQAVILVEDTKIVQVGTNLSLPAGAEIIDLGSATVLPGLIDAHTHLLENYNSEYG